MIENIIKLSGVPIVLMNFGAPIIGGIWLALLGEWKLIGIGIALLFTSHYILSIFMMIGFPVSAIGMKLFERGNPLGYLFAFLSLLYTNILIVASCIVAYIICAFCYRGTMGIEFIPYLLWSWGMAFSPWHFFASKEQDNEITGITLFSAQFFYVMFLITIFISENIAFIVLCLFGIVQLIILPCVNVYISRKATMYH